MKSNAKELIRSLFWFGLVGLSAMLVHFLTVTTLFVPIGIAPLKANVLGFLVAFGVSYLGHSKLTFKKETLLSRKEKVSEIIKFFGVAITGFLMNQALFFILLSYTSLGLDFSLGITLVLVSGLTFVLSKFWAFKGISE
jgi:putative flippase GtrA